MLIPKSDEALAVERQIVQKIDVIQLEDLCRAEGSHGKLQKLGEDTWRSAVVAATCRAFHDNESHRQRADAALMSSNVATALTNKLGCRPQTLAQYLAAAKKFSGEGAETQDVNKWARDLAGTLCKDLFTSGDADECDSDDENMASNAQTTLGLAFGNIMNRENLLEAMVGTQAYKDYISSESKVIRTDVAFGVEKLGSSDT